MSPFDRRSFVARSLTVLGGATAPAWIARAFGFVAPSSTTQDPQPAPKVDLVAWRKQQLAEAATTAKEHGKPLLVLVIPEADSMEREVSSWFGAWLTHGGEQASLTFGSCTLACARRGEIGEVLGVRGDALAPSKHPVSMLLVDHAGFGRGRDVAPRATRVDLDRDQVFRGSMIRLGVNARGEEIVRTFLEIMTKELRAGLDRHGDDRAALALAALGALDGAEQRALDAWVLDGQQAPAELLVRGIAELQLRVAALPEAERAKRSKVLVQAVEQVVVRAQVRGSRWSSRSGCGAEFENRTDADFDATMWSCGAGIVPPLCERFLSFYSVGG